MANEIHKILKQRLREAREANGLSQRDLADKLGLKVAIVSHWETGRRLPSLDVLVRLCEVLNRTPEFFLVEDIGGAKELSKPVKRLARLAETLNAENVQTLISVADSLSKRR